MADSKITALTAISTVDPAADPLVIVDVSDTSMAASGTTKKSTINQLLGSGGTATLASATITGDLTVDTSTLKVDSVNNRVGVLTATPAAPLDILGNGLADALLIRGNDNANCKIRMANSGAGGEEFSISVGYPGASNSSLVFRSITAAINRYVIDQTGAHTWATNAGTAMTLNANGLGIGVTPSAWTTYSALQIKNGSIANYSPTQDLRISSNAYYASGVWKRIAAAFATQYLQDGSSGLHQWYTAATGAADSTITTFTTAAMTLDASGNLLMGKSSASATTIGFEGRANGTVNSTLASSVDANATYAAYSTGAAAYRFYVGMGGTVYATNTTISAISDARLKENVQDIDVGLGAILALKPRKFDWKAGKGKDIKGDRGFIAQEFEQVFPNLIDEWKDPAPEGEAPYKSVRQDLIPVLVKAIQELTARVQTLETR